MTGRPYKQIFLSIITVTYILITAFWLAPDSELKKRIVDPVRPFWLFWHLDQSWALFSPVIRSINYHTVGLVTLKDGSKLIWEVPRMDKLDVVRRFQHEKFRKWGIDSLPWPDHKEFWPYLARYVGKRVYDKDNPPVQFSLLLYWANIPPPTPDKFVLKDKLPRHSTCNHVFTYRYTEEDFQ